MTDEVAPTRDRVVSLRFTDDERTGLEKRAADVGVSLSELIRRCALAVLFPAVPAAGTYTTSAPLARIDFDATARQLDDARQAVRRLVHMEREHLGSGPDGHLSLRDLAPLQHALHIDPEETP